jgi:hypothetical protein
MRKVFLVTVFVPVLLLANSSQNTAPETRPSLSGRWIVTADFYGTPIYFSFGTRPAGRQAHR